MTSRHNTVAAANYNVSKVQRLEAGLTGGLGYGYSKKRILFAFWHEMWPVLEGSGWVKVCGTGKHQGSLFFVRPGVHKLSGAQKGKDYYDKIKHVIDNVLKRQNAVEHAAAEAYTKEMKELETIDPSQHILSVAGYPSHRLAQQSSFRSLPDSHWKDNRKNYPKKSSRVGTAYQAEIPVRTDWTMDLSEPNNDISR